MVRPPGFQGQRSFNSPQKSSLENLLENFVLTQTKQNEEFKNQNQSMNEALRQLASKVDSMATHNKMLETQITQVAQQVVLSSRFPSVFPGQPEPGPKGQLNVVTLINGKQLEEPKRSDVEVNVRDESERTQPSSERVDEEKEKPPIPFPKRFSKAKIVEQFKNSIIQNKLPPKLKDPGSFSIPCVIGDMNFECALRDVGASVSLMHLSVCKKLDVGELKPTNISLQVVDRSVKYPVGILEDIPIKVGQLFIPADFVVLEMDEDSQECPLGPLSQDGLVACLIVSTSHEDLAKEADAYANLLDEYPYLPNLNFKELAVENSAPLPKKAQQAELKPLPSNLKYAFLGKNSTLPVILSAELNSNTPIYNSASVF
uniref:Uncharacterized protein LOC113787004 n=1 Tax=Cicer arietinum TaxID=3827 RepID=A0A3Q7XT58_CICAR|nr:uncharacterized protein LOC113787004 [Cicer arietinum]